MKPLITFTVSIGLDRTGEHFEVEAKRSSEPTQFLDESSVQDLAEEICGATIDWLQEAFQE